GGPRQTPAARAPGGARVPSRRPIDPRSAHGRCRRRRSAGQRRPSGVGGNVKRGPLLLVEDHPGLRAVLVDAATGEGIEVEAVETVAAARRHLATGTFAFVLTDLKLPDGTGLEVVDAARRAGTPVVVMTAFGSVGTAVEAMKRGAIDFLEKPVELD